MTPHVAPAASPASRAAPGLYGLLMVAAAGLPNDETYARMLASQAGGLGALPPGLGLSRRDFTALMTRHFPGFKLPAPLSGEPDLGARRQEWHDLHTLLLENRAGADESEVWMGAIVASACMGGDHLWQDLGLWSRVELSRLMKENFPALVAANDRDMKWKKFLYKQLCNQAGIHVCRSPSCEVCVDYAKCFGPE